MHTPSRRAGESARRRWHRPAGARRAHTPSITGDQLEKHLIHAHIGIARLDPTFRVLWVNEAFARLNNRSLQEFMGANFFDLIPDDPLISIFQEVLLSGAPQTVFGRPLPPLLGEPTPTYWDMSVQPYHEGGLLLVLNDATTRERAMQEFQQAQALFVHLFETAPDANLLINQHGEIMTANHQAEVLFGYQRYELIGRSVESLMPASFRQGHTHLRSGFWQNMQKRPMGAGLELYAQRKNGDLFPVDIILSPLSTEQGPVVLCVIHDISMRMANQKALQAQTALVQLLQEITAADNQSISPTLAFQVALDRLCAFLGWPAGHAYLAGQDAVLASSHIWNSQLPPEMSTIREASEALTFRPGEGLIGQVVVTAQPLWWTHPEDRPNFRLKQEARAAGIQTALGVPVMVEREVVAVLQFFTYDLVEPDPDLLEALPHVGVQLGRVIERQRAEEALNKRAAQLRALVSNLPVILLALDARGQITFLDGRGLQSIGRQPGDLVGQSVYDLLDENREVQVSLQRALHGQETHSELHTFNGTYEIFFSPYTDADGRPEGVIVLAFDITLRKQMEADLEEIKHHLMESVESERMRLAQQIHDGPLQDLYGVFYQVQEVKSQLAPEQQAGVDAVLDTIQMVNATLRFICGELRPTTLAHLGLKIAIRSHSERLQERYPALIIHLDLEDDTHQLDSSQRLGLYRIYQNLINNVIRHAQARHSWVRLKLLPEQVVLEVQDNGQGFETPASWVELVRKGCFGLTGAQERAAALGGDLEVISRPGSGALARVIIPRALL